MLLTEAFINSLIDILANVIPVLRSNMETKSVWEIGRRFKIKALVNFIYEG